MSLEMSFFDKNLLSFIRKKVGLVSLLNSYCINLEFTGSQWRCLSPFTSEKTPSFYVLKRGDSFKCFSSGQHGDIFTFVKLRESLNFQEAVLFILKRYGLREVSGYCSSSKKPFIKPKPGVDKSIALINRWTSHFYHKNLIFNKKNRFLLVKYFLIYRKTKFRFIKFFSLGVANYDSSNMVRSLNNLGFDKAMLDQSQLFYPNHTILKPKLVNRVVIPLRDSNGDTVSFSGRSIHSAQGVKNIPKYLNISNTSLLKKGTRILNVGMLKTFGGRRDVFVVEGPFDVFRLMSVGCFNVISFLGTNVNFKEILSFKTYFKVLYVFFDNDLAGIGSSLKFIRFSINNSVPSKIVYLLKNKSDPDLFFKRYSKTSRQVLDFIKEKGLSPIEYLIKLFLNGRGDFYSCSGFKERINFVFSFIKGTDDPYELRRHIDLISQFTYTNTTTLKNEFNNYLFFIKGFGEKRFSTTEKRLSHVHYFSFFKTNGYLWNDNLTTVTNSPGLFLKLYSLKNFLVVKKELLESKGLVNEFHKLHLFQKFIWHEITCLVETYKLKYCFSLELIETINSFKRRALCDIISKACFLGNKLRLTGCILNITNT